MAKVPVQCPYCPAKGSMDEAYVGKEISCPACRKSFVLPVSSRVAEQSASKESRGSVPTLLDQLDGIEDVGGIYEMLRTRPLDEIRELCSSFALGELRLDLDSILGDVRNSKRFEVVTFLAQILVRYEKICAEKPNLRLPRSLPAKELAELLMGNLMPFLSQQQGLDITVGLRNRLYDFALDLVRADRHQDALTCLLVSRPSLYEDHEFWICACRYNIARETRNPQDTAAAVAAAEQIVTGKVKAPSKCVEGARWMLGELRNGKT